MLHSSLSNLLKGRISRPQLLKIHAKVFVLGAHQDNLVATRLIGHYPSQLALCVFNYLHSPNIFPCNAIIRSLAQEGYSDSAFLVFKRLNFWSLLPNDLTFSFICKACFRASDVGYVKQVHTHVLKLGYGDDFVVCNGLVGVYARGFSDLVSARKLFDEMPEKGLVCCWTSLIAGYAKLGQSEEALQLFLVMVRDNLRPDDETMVSVLSACSNLDIENNEKWAKILSQFEENCVSKRFGFDALYTVLVYIYGKLEKVEDGRQIFNKISAQGKTSVIAWNVMIGAYVQNSDASEALSLFRQMEDFKTCPNHVTMVSVLSACAQIGDLELGLWIHEYMKSKEWKDMRQRFSVYPKLEHYACYVDLLSRSGCIQEALEVVISMPYEPNGFVWGSLLGGCVLHKKLEYAENISKMLVRADPDNSAGYVLLSNAYASDRRWGDVSELRCFMKEKGVKKHSANSWVSIEGAVHEFFAGSPSHPQIGQLLDILDGLSMKMKLGIT
ncbi:hypothetical protein ACET3Z_031004 [Daucus carota]